MKRRKLTIEEREHIIRQIKQFGLVRTAHRMHVTPYTLHKVSTSPDMIFNPATISRLIHMPRYVAYKRETKVQAFRRLGIDTRKLVYFTSSGLKGPRVFVNEEMSPYKAQEIYTYLLMKKAQRQDEKLIRELVPVSYDILRFRTVVQVFYYGERGLRCGITLRGIHLHDLQRVLRIIPPRYSAHGIYKTLKPHLDVMKSEGKLLQWDANPIDASDLVTVHRIQYTIDFA